MYTLYTLCIQDFGFFSRLPGRPPGRAANQPRVQRQWAGPPAAAPTIFPPIPSFWRQFHSTQDSQVARCCLASFRMSRRAALPAGAWLTFACALCTGANLTIRPASRGREALASTKWCALRHAACFVLAVTAQAHDAQQHCRTAMRIHCLASSLTLPHTASCAVLRQVDFRSDRQARHLPGSCTSRSGLLKHCQGHNISQPSNPRVRSV